MRTTIDINTFTNFEDQELTHYQVRVDNFVFYSGPDRPTERQIKAIEDTYRKESMDRSR